MKKITLCFLPILFIFCGNNKETRAVNFDLRDIDIKIQKIDKDVDTSSADSVQVIRDKSIVSISDGVDQSTVTQSTYMTGMSKAMQGGAQFGDYMVYGASPTLRIYNLKTKTLGFIVVTAGLAADIANHYNSMAFSNEFHTPSDSFPILYMASNKPRSLGGLSFGSAIYGVRIYMSGSKMKAQLIHTITIKGTSWIDIAIDNMNDFLLLRLNEGENYRNVKIARPLSVNGDITVTLNPTIILQDFKTLREPLGRSSGQGFLFYNNKLYMTTGTGGQSGKERIMVINTLTEKMEQIVDLRASGLKGEPEFIIRYDNRFFVAYRSGILYEIAFKQ